MAIISDSVKLQDLVRALSIQYDKFLTNKQYRSTQYKSDEEYMSQQTIIASEIKRQEGIVFDILENYFKEFFPTLKLIAYDSRYVSFNRAKTILGLILVEGMKEGDETTIRAFFHQNFLMEIKIDKLEDLPEEIRKKFKK